MENATRSARLRPTWRPTSASLAIANAKPARRRMEAPALLAMVALVSTPSSTAIRASMSASLASMETGTLLSAQRASIRARLALRTLTCASAARCRLLASQSTNSFSSTSASMPAQQAGSPMKMLAPMCASSAPTTALPAKKARCSVRRAMQV